MSCIVSGTSAGVAAAAAPAGACVSEDMKTMLLCEGVNFEVVRARRVRRCGEVQERRQIIPTRSCAHEVYVRPFR